MLVVPQEIRGFQHGLREKGGSDVGVIWKRGQQYVVVYYDARGRRRWETIGPNKREAQQVLAERVWERRNGKFRVTKQSTLSSDCPRVRATFCPHVNPNNRHTASGLGMDGQYTGA